MTLNTRELLFFSYKKYLVYTMKLRLILQKLYTSNYTIKEITNENSTLVLYYLQ